MDLGGVHHHPLMADALVINALMNTLMRSN